MRCAYVVKRLTLCDQRLNDLRDPKKFIRRLSNAGMRVFNGFTVRCICFMRGIVCLDLAAMFQHFAAAAYIRRFIQQFALRRLILVTNGHTYDAFRAAFAAGVVTPVNTGFLAESVSLTSESAQAVVFAGERDPAGKESVMQYFARDGRCRPFKPPANCGK